MKAPKQDVEVSRNEMQSASPRYKLVDPLWVHIPGWPRAMPCHVMASRAMPGHIFTCHAIFFRVMPCHKYSVPCRVKVFDLGTNKNVFTGGLPPPRPPAVPWGLPAPQTPWRGACSPPCPPAYREAPPLAISGSPFFVGTKILVPRSWYQNLGSGSW